ncbi:MAG: hypothetical protein M3032_07000, partial [Verrucomicrobiota bacterium]|nr:hypothetical protein [Verrucomicrobiota bacterium]
MKKSSRTIDQCSACHSLTVTLRLAMLAAAMIALGLSASLSARPAPLSNLEELSNVAAPKARNCSTGLVQEAYGKLPFTFEANRGQADAAFDFVARGAGYSLAVSHSGAVFQLRSGQRQDHRSRVLRMDLLGANSEAAGEGLD